MHGRAGHFNNQHFGEELNLGVEKVAGVAGRAVFLQADGYVDVREDFAGCLVVGERAGAKSFDIREVDLCPDGGCRVVELLACTDDVDRAEPSSVQIGRASCRERV